MAVMKSLSSSPIKEVAEEKASMKEGILTVLHFERESPTKSSSSIRRTLSADMSSKKWLAQNGFFLTPPAMMKKNVSSEVLALQIPHNHHSSSSHDEGEEYSTPSQDDVWRSIQSQKAKRESEPVWGSIVTNQRNNENKSPCSIPMPPYAVKRSSSTLSEKSLKICTESLGSETGSYCFLPSYPCSEFSCDADDYQERQRIITESEFEDTILSENIRITKYKSAPVRSFPPPIRSISSGDSLHVQSQRENGRLVLEAVSVPPKNFFQAQRGNGRLVLTLINRKITSDDEAAGEFDAEVFDHVQEVSDEENNEDDAELRSSLSPNGILSVQKSSLVMNKFISLGNKNNTTWINKVVEEEKDHLKISQSLPPPPPHVSRMIPKPPQPPTSVSLNAYEYFWRNKTTTVSKEGFINPMIATTKTMHMKRSNYNDNDKIIYGAKDYRNHDFVLMRGGKAESFVPYVKGCKEPKRSILIWEPFCIATS